MDFDLLWLENKVTFSLFFYLLVEDPGQNLCRCVLSSKFLFLFSNLFVTANLTALENLLF